MFLSSFAMCLLFCLNVKAQQKTFQIDSAYTIYTKDTFCLNNAEFCWVFNYHSHKNYANKNESVLIGDFSFIKNGAVEPKHIVFTDKASYKWEWKNYVFIISDYDYDSSMKISTSVIKQ